jgi:hypothetical protein
MKPEPMSSNLAGERQNDAAHTPQFGKRVVHKRVGFHKFESIPEDFSSWVIFYGPQK